MRWGINFLANEYDALLESAFKEAGAPQHTIDHVDCPACQLIDKRMNSDLLGMANRTFSEAAKVWQGVRRNSNILHDRTHESSEENITALGKFFNNIQMSSINPGMLKAYQLGRKANAMLVGDKIHRPWKPRLGLCMAQPSISAAPCAFRCISIGL